MNVIAKISCYFERSVVTLKLRKEYLNTVTSDIQCISLTQDKKLNSFICTTLLYGNICGSNKLSKQSGFLAHPLYTVYYWLELLDGRCSQ